MELGLVEADEGMHILEISAGAVLGYILYLVLFLAGVLEQNFDGAPLEAVYEDHREVVGSLNQKTRGQIKDILPLEKYTREATLLYALRNYKKRNEPLLHR